jgi:hypothetical protein
MISPGCCVGDIVTTIYFHVVLNAYIDYLSDALWHTGAAGMWLRINGKFTKGKLKSSLLS